MEVDETQNLIKPIGGAVQFRDTEEVREQAKSAHATARLAKSPVNGVSTINSGVRRINGEGKVVPTPTTSRLVPRRLRASPSLAMSRSRDGGIDLNAKNMQLNLHQDAPAATVADLAMISHLRSTDFAGLDFDIESEVPLRDVPAFLGLESH